MSDTGDGDIQVFFGAMSQAVGRVYARYTGPVSDDTLQISGTLTGPTCLYAQTLPATSRFIEQARGISPLAEALVPEPCFWTPQMPHLYRVVIQVARGTTILSKLERDFGIRPLGAVRNSLRFDFKRWVLRGVGQQAISADELEGWHATDTALVIGQPSDAVCEVASRVGVLVVAELDSPVSAEIRRLSQWPAVGIISLPTGGAAPQAGLAPNVLWAERFSSGTSLVPAPWAELAICDVGEFDEPRATDVAIPILVRRRLASWDRVCEARGGCDRLQRDLAPAGQFAGYIV